MWFSGQGTGSDGVTIMEAVRFGETLGWGVIVEGHEADVVTRSLDGVARSLSEVGCVLVDLVGLSDRSNVDVAGFGEMLG